MHRSTPGNPVKKYQKCRKRARISITVALRPNVERRQTARKLRKMRQGAEEHRGP
jgi:hypothetical protein